MSTLKNRKCYTPIAFDERVTFWLQRARSLPCACAFAVLYAYCMRVRLHNGYTQAYEQIMQHTDKHKAVTGRVEAKKLLSRRRQSNYSNIHISSKVSYTRRWESACSYLPMPTFLKVSKLNFFEKCWENDVILVQCPFKIGYDIIVRQFRSPPFIPSKKAIHLVSRGKIGWLWIEGLWSLSCTHSSTGCMHTICCC